MIDHEHSLVDAIDNRLRVSFRYKSSDEQWSTLRVVEPWVYGIKNSKESLYGYQLEGGDRGPKRFDLRRVKDIKLTGESSDVHPDKVDITKWDSIKAQWIPQLAA